MGRLNSDDMRTLRFSGTAPDLLTQVNAEHAAISDNMARGTVELHVNGNTGSTVPERTVEGLVKNGLLIRRTNGNGPEYVLSTTGAPSFKTSSGSLRWVSEVCIVTVITYMTPVGAYPLAEVNHET
jgi:hypothetical protein